MICCTVRYRWGDQYGGIAPIVTDGRGDALLFSGGRLQARLAGSGARARLARMLGRCGTCAPVPAGIPHTLDGLLHLTAPTVPGPQAGHQIVVTRKDDPDDAAGGT